jgi:hypothetical protein
MFLESTHPDRIGRSSFSLDHPFIFTYIAFIIDRIVNCAGFILAEGVFTNNKQAAKSWYFILNDRIVFIKLQEVNGFRS